MTIASAAGRRMLSVSSIGHTIETRFAPPGRTRQSLADTRNSAGTIALDCRWSLTMAPIGLVALIRDLVASQTQMLTGLLAEALSAVRHCAGLDCKPTTTTCIGGITQIGRAHV